MENLDINRIWWNLYKNRNIRCKQQNVACTFYFVLFNYAIVGILCLFKIKFICLFCKIEQYICFKGSRIIRIILYCFGFCKLLFLNASIIWWMRFFVCRFLHKAVVSCGCRSPPLRFWFVFKNKIGGIKNA